MTPNDLDERRVLLERLGAMWRIRLFEERVRDLHIAKQIVGSVHLCIGQEAIAVGACARLDLPHDAVFATYRGHGWALACGVGLVEMFGELLGRECGVNGGRGGSAYLSAPDRGFYGENSIVGAHLPIAVGGAMAGTWTGSSRVCLAVCGDGALNQGAVHEALNFASIRNAPVVFIVENNVYSELTPIRSMVRNPQLTDRALPFGIPASRTDGNDVEAVAHAIGNAVLECRQGRGPVLIEAATERLVGHYIGDAELYRPKGEVESAMARDPLQRTAERLRELRIEASVVEGVEDDARKAVDDAAEVALACPRANPETVREHLYA